MFFVEAAVALSVVCTLPKKSVRTRDEISEPVQCIITTDTPPRSFQMADGVSLEHKVNNELKSIDGVQDVVIKQSGTSYEVNVVMDTFAFECYEKVIEEELALFDKHPDLSFAFNVTFSEGANRSDSLLNAA